MDIDRAESTRPVLIDARTLSGCRHRLRLDTERGGEVAGVPEDPGVKQRRDAAAAHRDHVRATLTRDSDGWVQIEPVGPTSERAAATLAACAAGVRRIWGAVLPSEPDTGRRGRAELLVHDDDRGGYIPVIVVNHKVTDPRNGDIAGGALTSALDVWEPREDSVRRIRPQPRDSMRLAQLYRMLQRHGFASPAVQGGAIGYAFDCILVHDLSSVLAEYDERYADRIGVARGELPTAPSQIPECRSCPWWAECRDWLTRHRDVSLVATGARAEVLRAASVETVDELASWTGEPPEDWQFGNFDDSVVTALAWLRDVALVRRHETVSVARADVEVDVDLESFQEHGAYLWGTLLNGEYRPFVTWDPLPTRDEARSFAEFWAWLMAVRADAAASGKTFAAYCYSRQAEDKWLLDSARRFAGDPGVPTVAEIKAFIDGPQWVDMFQAVTEQFVCPHGKGLKKIAPVAGFAWRDPEAGGEASMGWYRDAVGYDAEPDLTQRTRILEYNEDDVFATRVLRDWMSGSAVAEVPSAAELRTSALAR